MKKLLATFVVLGAFLIIPLTVFAIDDSFSIAYGGQTHVSKDKNLPYDYPYINFYNHNVSVDGQLAASVMKKGIFGYTLEERLEAWLKGRETYTYNYQYHGKGTYHAVFVIDHINGSGYMAGSYLLSSRETPAN